MPASKDLLNAAVLPLGCNCHLGAALAGYGHHESSLLRWAALPVQPLLDFTEGRGRLFDGRMMFRLEGTDYGALDFAGMRKKLRATAFAGFVNSILFARGERWHGVQLGAAEAASLSFDEIRAANAAKLAHLEAKWRAQLAGETPVVAVRLEWAPVVETAPYVRLGAALRRANAQASLHVISPAGGPQGMIDGVRFAILRSPLPPLSDVMNVSATQEEFSALFASLGIERKGAVKGYIFEA